MAALLDLLGSVEQRLEGPDLIGLLNEHQQFIEQRWPDSSASNDGRDALARLAEMRERRIRRKLSLETANGVVAVSWRVAWTAAGIGAAWNGFVQ